eukprot:g73570.t1
MVEEWRNGADIPDILRLTYETPQNCPKCQSTSTYSGFLGQHLCDNDACNHRFPERVTSFSFPTTPNPNMKT